MELSSNKSFHRSLNTNPYESRIAVGCGWEDQKTHKSLFIKLE